jgi:glycine cleavage system H lipoate-binding protein
MNIANSYSESAKVFVKDSNDKLHEHRTTCKNKPTTTVSEALKTNPNEYNTPSCTPPTIEMSLSCNPGKTFETVERRYYTRYYKPLDNEEDQVVLLHSNRICLVSLAPKHPIIRQNLKIEHLEFEVGNKRKPINRLSNKVSGKGKKGGQSVDEKAILCLVHCVNGNKYPIRSCVRGTLIEINPLIVKNPSLLVEKPFSEGHLAVILPKLPDGLVRLKADLMTEERYMEETDCLTLASNSDTKRIN